MTERSADEIAQTVFCKLSDLTARLHAGEGLHGRDYRALCDSLRAYADRTSKQTSIPKAHAQTLSMILPLLMPFSFSYKGEPARRIGEAVEELEALVNLCLDYPESS